MPVAKNITVVSSLRTFELLQPIRSSAVGTNQSVDVLCSGGGVIDGVIYDISLSSTRIFGRKFDNLTMVFLSYTYVSVSVSIFV